MVNLTAIGERAIKELSKNICGKGSVGNQSKDTTIREES